MTSRPQTRRYCCVTKPWRGAIDLVVPQLWIYEVGNTLAGRFPNDADELLASLADFGLRDWAAECTDTPQMTASGSTERLGGVESNK